MPRRAQARLHVAPGSNSRFSSRRQLRLKFKRVSLRNVNFVGRSGRRCSIRAWSTIARTEPRPPRYLVLFCVFYTKEYRVNEESSRFRPAARQLLGTHVGLPHAYRYGINQAFYELHNCTPYPRGRSFLLFLRCKIRTVYHQSQVQAVGAA